MPERENGPGVTRAASEVTPPRGTPPSVAQLVDHLEQVQRRVLQDALSEATSAYWCRRAATFDRVGNERCDEVARACRARAAVSLLQGDDDEPELLDVLREAS